MQVFHDTGEALKAFFRHDGPIMAGHLTFLGLLGLFPFLIFLLAVASLVGQTNTGIDAITFLFDHIPVEVAEALRKPVLDVLYATGGGVLTLGLLGSIWVASAALGTVRLAVDRAFEGGAPPAFWLRRLHGLGLLIVSALCILAGMSLVLLGPILWRAATAAVPALADWTHLFETLRYGGGAAVFLLAISGMLFGLKPRYQGRFVPVLRGALLTLLLWLLAGTIFSFYLKHFNTYHLTYGSLAGVVIALLFFYLLTAAFLLGAELNAAIARRLWPPPGQRRGQD